MNNQKIHLCAKGSRKVGQAFIEETEYLSGLFNCIEIDFNYPHDKNFNEELEFLKKIKKEKNLEYTIHLQYFSGSLNDFSEKIRQESINEIKKEIDTGVSIGALVATLHPALEPYGLKIQGREDLEIDSYKKIAQYASKKGLKIGLENEAQTCFWFPDRACRFNNILEVVEKVNLDNFGLTIDIGHANVTGEDYGKALENNIDKVFHIHAHDNLGKPENNIRKFNRPDPHLPLGAGDINWGEIISKIKRKDYQGYLEFECDIDRMQESIEYLNRLA